MAMLKRKIEAALGEHAAKVREAAAILGMIALLVALAFFFKYHWLTSAGLYRREYEGEVVEKRLAGRETEYGSRFTRRLLIEGAGGERFEVVVGEGLYNGVEAGAWVKAGRAGVEIRKAAVDHQRP